VTSPWFPDGQPDPLILASVSPRRSHILRQVGVRFAQAAPEADETWPAGMPVGEAVKVLALRKARAVAPGYPDGVVIGADTEVILDGTCLGKPDSQDGAVRMLRRLAGNRHLVVTGLALIEGLTGREYTEAVTTEVWMRSASDDELRAYAATGEPADKAGAYGIQGLGAGLVTRINGCYFNVVGLPISRLIECLQRIARARRVPE